MDNQQPQHPAASNGEAMWDNGAEKGTPSVNVTVAKGGCSKTNTTDPVRRSEEGREQFGTWLFDSPCCI